MLESYYQTIALELGIAPRQVNAVGTLLEEGSTMPFIARYRKEVTGSLDEVAISAIRDRLKDLEQLDARKESIINSLTGQGVITDSLRQAVEAAKTLAELEDIYLPYRPKRRTRAAIAREKDLSLSQRSSIPSLRGQSLSQRPRPISIRNVVSRPRKTPLPGLGT